MSNDLVWAMGRKEEAGFLVEREFLDGDPRKIEYVDTTLDMGDNPLFEAGRMYAGREVKPEHIPTKMMWSSKKHRPYDVFMQRGLILVSQEFKDIVEKLEPSTHQFFPIEVVYKDGSHARPMYFFNVCVRLDTMNRAHATAKMLHGISWDPSSGEFIFSKDQIGSRKVWIDKHVIHGLFFSNDIKTEIEKEKLTGAAFNGFPVF
ncbi:imm11 family protein [Roseibium sp. MMSF_3544]|uniref:imm11 family protein n=1 Tax=unclassified Roseibium TaxID=2629323 RepID=UPI00273EFBCB|nr:DUF1629 domain-containing protein [Roseibium sp. MMSF_3544]